MAFYLDNAISLGPVSTSRGLEKSPHPRRLLRRRRRILHFTSVRA